MFGLVNNAGIFPRASILEVTPELAREWAKVPGYRAYLAEAFDEEKADAFMEEIEERAEELHPTGRRLFGNWLTLAGVPARA